jgi:hypothetical protein
VAIAKIEHLYGVPAARVDGTPATKLFGRLWTSPNRLSAWVRPGDASSCSTDLDFRKSQFLAAPKTGVSFVDNFARAGEYTNVQTAKVPAYLAHA